MDFLFDIGRVLLNFDFETSLRKVATHDPDASIAKLLDHKFEFETGSMSATAFTHLACNTLGCDPDAFTSAWRDIFTPISPMWEDVRNLKSCGHRLILFSNTNAIHCPWIFGKFPEFSLFNASVLSFEIGAMKPGQEIYHHAIRQFRLVPERTLYIDDLPENIATGRQLGFLSHCYDLNNHAAFRRWLDETLRENQSMLCDSSEPIPH